MPFLLCYPYTSCTRSLSLSTSLSANTKSSLGRIWTDWRANRRIQRSLQSVWQRLGWKNYWRRTWNRDEISWTKTDGIWTEKHGNPRGSGWYDVIPPSFCIHLLYLHLLVFLHISINEKHDSTSTESPERITEMREKIETRKVCRRHHNHSLCVIRKKLPHESHDCLILCRHHWTACCSLSCTISFPYHLFLSTSCVLFLGLFFFFQQGTGR